MRVLWFAVTPSLYDEKSFGGWIASLERIVRKYGSDIELGIAFEHADRCFKAEKNGVTYYPINKFKSRWDKLRLMLDYNYDWEMLRPCMQKVIDDFNPDIIQCFGTEWPFGLISECTEVPVVIHMQGFSTIYSMSGRMAYRTYDIYKFHHYNPLSIVHFWYRSTKTPKSFERESRIMKVNRHFMGRTEWDKNLVRYYSPAAHYYHCEEALRKEITEASYQWRYQKREKMRIVTISSASTLKGNGIILQTAKLMTELGFNFEWRVAGSKESFKLFESIYGLKHEDWNIHLLGTLDADTVAKELSEADVYVHTAIIDNSPNSLCEAQYIGCPVVSSFVGGIPQLVENGKTGIFYPYNEPHTLAFRLIGLFQDEQILTSLSRNEIEVSHQRHDEMLIYQQLMNVYKEILS